MDVLDACALFQPELSLAVGAADVAVGLEVAHLHVLALEEVGHSRANAEIAVVLIQALVDVGRERAEHRETYQQQYHDHDRAAYKEVYQVQNARKYQDQRIQFIVAVTAAHELGSLHQKITHVITDAFECIIPITQLYARKIKSCESVEIAAAPTRVSRASR